MQKYNLGTFICLCVHYCEVNPFRKNVTWSIILTEQFTEFVLMFLILKQVLLLICR